MSKSNVEERDQGTYSRKHSLPSESSFPLTFVRPLLKLVPPLAPLKLSTKYFQNLFVQQPVVISISLYPFYFSDIVKLYNSKYLIVMYFYSIWIYFHEHPLLAGQQGKGKAISLTSLYHFNLLQRLSDISQTISAPS